MAPIKVMRVMVMATMTMTMKKEDLHQNNDGDRQNGDVVVQ